MRLDGTLLFVGVDGSTTVPPGRDAGHDDDGGRREHLHDHRGRFELDDGTAVTTGQMTGAIAVGLGSASSVSLVLS